MANTQAKDSTQPAAVQADDLKNGGGGAQLKDLVLHSPAGSSEVLTYTWPLQVGHGQKKHDNGVDILQTIRFVCEETPSIAFAFEDTDLMHINTACPQTMTSLVEKYNKAIDSLVALEKGTSLPQERLNKFAKPTLLKHIIQCVYNGSVTDPDKLNQYEPFSAEVYGETSFELISEMIDSVAVPENGNFIDLGSGVGQIVLQIAGTFSLKSCIGIERAETPAKYAVDMDLLFRKYMAWFGKQYSDFRLIKGDFLDEEHRSMILKANLIFVNNFAFGPAVDHQLKLHFSDVADGTIIVSSKAFCSLNFRTTERNLNDLGSIVRVRRIPALAGSVSWTCKPVSYYVHEMDRSLLQNYYDSKKSKGASNQQSGDNRVRNKRGAGAKRKNGVLKAAAGTNTATTANISTKKKSLIKQQLDDESTSQDQQQRQQQRQRSLSKQGSTEADTSTESDADTLTNLTLASNSESQMSNLKCENESATDEEENNNSTSNKKLINDRSSPSNASVTSGKTVKSTTTTVAIKATMRNGQLTAAQKQRRKLTRQAAIASKTAAAAQRIADAEEARELEIAKQRAAAANRHAAQSLFKEGNGNSSAGTSTSNAIRNGVFGVGRKGRLKKGGVRGRKCTTSAELDALHKYTLLSTSEEVQKKKLPPAPGTMDHPLSSILGDMKHEELPIPESPMEEPYGLHIFLNNTKNLYMAMLRKMKSPEYHQQIRLEIEKQQALKADLEKRSQQLEKQLGTLTAEGAELLKRQMLELDITDPTPAALVMKANSYVQKYKEMVGEVQRKKEEVAEQEIEHKRLLYMHLKDLPEFQKRLGQYRRGSLIDFTEEDAREIVIKELCSELNTRHVLKDKMNGLTVQCNELLLRQQQHQPVEEKVQIIKQEPMVNGVGNQNGIVHSTHLITGAVHKANGMNTGSNKAVARRGRDNRARNNEWPDVPDIGKIEESNPEVLAQKILETGRQIEAKKGLNSSSLVVNGKYPADDKRIINGKLPPVMAGTQLNLGQKDSTLMPAPPGNAKQLPSPMPRMNTMGILPKCEMTEVLGRKNGMSITLTESPKLANFEDRIRSIITSSLSGDRDRKPILHANESLPNQQQPAIKRFKHMHSPNAPDNISSYQQQPSNCNGYTTSPNLMHLNGNTTTISPVTPPLPMATHIGSSAPQTHNPANSYGKYANSQVSSTHKLAQNSTVLGPANVNKEPLSCAQTIKQQHQHYPPSRNGPHVVNGGGSHGGLYAPTDMRCNNRRMSLSYEQFLLQQQQQEHQQHAYVLAAHTQAQHRHHQTVQSPNSMQQQQQMQAQAHHSQQQMSYRRGSEFKAPPVNDRTGSREHLDELLISRSNTANSSLDAPVHYVPTRDRLMAHERSSSRESAASQPMALHSPAALSIQPIRPSSRPSSTSSQPDYTLVSPTKAVVRRHMSQSQEKLNVLPHHASSAALNGNGNGNGAGVMQAKTIGDLVNVEIERRLELTSQSHYADRERSNRDRPLINPNAQRPERVYVRLQNDGHLVNGSDIVTGNDLSTLAIAAVSQKAHSPGSAVSVMSPPIRDYNGILGNHRQQPTQSANSKTPIKYQTVPLPRAEIKGCIEAYFNEEQRQQQQQQQLQKRDRSAGRAPRMNGVNQPLEGLAASLQDHVLMARKFKEESEERQRRAAAASATSSSDHKVNYQYNGEHQAPPIAHHQAQGSLGQAANLCNGTTAPPQKAEITLNCERSLLSPNYASRPLKVPRYALESSLIGHRNSLASSVNISASLLPQPVALTTPLPAPISPSSTTERRNGGHKINMEPLLMSPEINSSVVGGDERSATSHLYNVLPYNNNNNNNAHAYHHNQDISNLEQSRPMADQNYTQRHHHATSASLLSSSSSIVTGNCRHKADDDDSDWQHFSSEFDRVAALVSTELHEMDKTRRRSIVGHHQQDSSSVATLSSLSASTTSSISCNASPDSGITTACSNNSDSARAFLSTSSSSSQLELLPISSGGSTSSSSGVYSLHSGRNTATTPTSMTASAELQHYQDHHALGASELNSNLTATAASSAVASKTAAAISMSPPPITDELLMKTIESPVLSDMGLPRSPSPSNGVAMGIPTPPRTTTPPPAQLSSTPNRHFMEHCKIPLKYQRKSKSSSQKHYKKKFCERNWDLVCDDFSSIVDSSDLVDGAVAAQSTKHSDQIDTHQQREALTHGAPASAHISSKFRPKGKDWDWSMESSAGDATNANVGMSVALTNTAATTATN